MIEIGWEIKFLNLTNCDLLVENECSQAVVNFIKCLSKISKITSVY